MGDCLQPWLENWEQELEYKLFLPEEQGEYQIRFNVDVLLRGNTQARGEFFSKLFNIGVLSINEIRTMENFTTIGPEGDEHYVPVNLQTAEKAAAGSPSEDGDGVVVGEGDDVQKTALNGAQIKSIVDMVAAVAAGDMSKESALAVIKIAFPNISDAEIAQLTSGMEKIPAKTTPPEVEQ